MSNKFIELLSINYYDIEMNREFRGLVKLLKKIFKQIKRPQNFLDLINNPKLFFSLLAFTFSGLKSTAFSIDELKNEFHSIVFIQQKAILDLSQNETFFQQVTWKQKRLIRKYLQGFIKLFITISRDSYNLEKEDCILLFNNFLEFFLTILKTEFNEFLLCSDKEFFYGADKFLRHFNCSDSIQKLHIKLITFYHEIMQKIYASKKRNLQLLDRITQWLKKLIARTGKISVNNYEANPILLNLSDIYFFVIEISTLESYYLKGLSR